MVKRKDGGAVLGAILETQGTTLADAARLLGCSRAAVCQLVRGTRRPGLDLALRISEQFDVEVELWKR